MRRQQGFSLTELLIALVVGSIAYSFWINMIVPRRKAQAQKAQAQKAGGQGHD